MNDILNQFRGRTPVPAASNREAYVAFEAYNNRCPRLDIRCRLQSPEGLSYLVPYFGLHSVVYNRNHIYIAASGLFITVKGRNLRPIVLAIQAESCGYVQEFDSELFNALPEHDDKETPYIDSIRVEVMTKNARPDGVRE